MKRLLGISLILSLLIFELVNMGYSNEQGKADLFQSGYWEAWMNKELKMRLDKVIELVQEEKKDISKLKKFLKDENLLVRGIAAIGLADEDNPEGVRDLIGLLGFKYYSGINIAISYTQAKLRLNIPLWDVAEQKIKKLGKSALPYLIKMIKDKQIIGTWEWDNAIGLIIRLNAQEMIIPEIVSLLKHPNPQIREHVQDLFYYTHYTHYFAGKRRLVNKSILELTVYELVKLLNHPVAGSPASSIIAHLNRRFPETMRKAVSNLLKHPNPKIQSGAVRIWGICRDTKAIPELTELLSNKEPMVRGAAIWSIGIMYYYYDLPREKVSNKILRRLYKLLDSEERFGEKMIFFTGEGKLMLQASKEQEIVFWTLKTLFPVRGIKEKSPDEIVEYWKRKIEGRLDNIMQDRMK